MQKRKLGKTSLETSIIGAGGFHLIETPKKEVTYILNEYLDNGGNYIETAADYGEGISEKKIGNAISGRREDYILASKCVERNKEEAEISINTSLKNLKTDHLDIIFMHAVQSIKESDEIMAVNGAYESFLKAQKEGKVRYIGISGHGQPDALIFSIQNYPYDVLLTGFNYYDKFNFPTTESILLKECIDRGIGVIGMKSLADGYLYRSPEQAIRYSLSLPISTLVLGMNTREYLHKDLAIVNNFKPLTEEEKEKVYFNAVELGSYVCRQCGKCDAAMEINPSEIFLIEGEFDRQMDDGAVKEPPEYALIERLKFWFNQQESAFEKYKQLKVKVDVATDYGHLNTKCPYKIDIDRKLKLAHSELSKGNYIF